MPSDAHEVSCRAERGIYVFPFKCMDSSLPAVALNDRDWFYCNNSWDSLVLEWRLKKCHAERSEASMYFRSRKNIDSSLRSE